MELTILETPNKWTAKIAKSTQQLEWKSIQIRVGYKVQPIPIPSSIITLKIINKTPKKYNQKLKLLIRENNISGQPINNGNQ